MIPNTMAGWLLTGHGAFDRLVFRDDITVPEPGADEVLIRVAASAINNTDINTRVGWYSKSVRGDTASAGGGESVVADGTGAATAPVAQNTSTAAASDRAAERRADGGWSGRPLAFPRIQGADCCGTIVAVGEKVPQKRIGERVLVRTLQSTGAEREGGGPFATWTFGSECDGGFAEYAVTFAEDALPVRSPWSDVELASIPCAYSTAEGMLSRAALGAERVLVTGASGGVGSAAVQLAKRRGAEVTALTSPSKAATLRELGADATLDRDAALPTDSFDVVVDLVGGPRWPALLDTLRRGGRYVVSGAIAGPIVELDLRTLYLRDLSLLGSTFQPAHILPDVIAAIEAEEIRPLIAETYPLHSLIEAQKAFLSKGFVGKIAIEVGEWEREG